MRYWILCLLAVVGCSTRSTSSPGVPPTAAQAVSVPEAKRTTSGEIAARNLSGQISALERRNKTRELVDPLLARADYFGQLSDYDRALQLAEQAVVDAPDDAAAYLLRGRVRSRLHRFDEALADYNRAEQLGASAAALAEPRDIVRRARAGASERTVESYREALRAQKGVSPFPVAWTYMQLGSHWERQGKIGFALDHYQAAVDRLPGYAHAVAHLAAAEAATDNLAAAIARLRPLIETSDDPEYVGLLGALLLEAGDQEAAEPLLARARAGYTALEEKHPLAFADHAARFWLGAGDDARHAVGLARMNYRNRETDEALALLLDAIHATGTDSAEQCTLAVEAAGRDDASAYLLFAASRAYGVCGHPDEADALIERAAVATRPR